MISVIIPCFNHGRYLAAAVHSALEQEGVAVQVIVVDDGSTDETAEVAAGFGDAIIYRFQQNLGVAAAFNTGLSAAAGDYLYLLGADDVLLPGALRALAGYLDVHPDEGAVYGDGFFCDDQLLPLGRLSDSWRAAPTGNILPYYITHTILAAFLYRLPAIRRHGLTFDTALGVGEDWDFNIRFAAYERIGSLDFPCYLYRLHPDNSLNRRPTERQDSLIRNRRKVMNSWFFEGLPEEARARFLTDFLVHHLRGRPAEQSELLVGPQVAALSPAAVSRLYQSYGLSALEAGENERARERLRKSIGAKARPVTAGLLVAAYLPPRAVVPALRATRRVAKRDWEHPMDRLLPGRSDE